MCDGVSDLDRVADGPDVLVTGAHVLIDPDAAQLADIDARCSSQLDLGLHTDAQDHEVGRQSRAVAEDDRRGPSVFGLGRLFESDHHRADPNIDVAILELPVRPERDVLVDGTENLRGGLDQRDRHTEVRELLDHLESDVAGTHHGGVARQNPLVPLDHGVHVRNGTKGEVTGPVDSGNRRAQRGRARSQDEVVVALRVDLVRLEVANLDVPGLSVDADRLAPSTNVEIESVLQALGSLDQQALAVLDLPTDVERKPAVRVRDETASFDHDDVRLFRQPTGPGGDAGTARDTTDDDDLPA